MAGPDEERAELLEKTASEVRACTLCRLHEGRTWAVPGTGPLDAAVFLIGEAPGREEDARGEPFVGSAGKVLDKALAAARLPRRSAFITNVVKCRPPANRGPRADEIEACRPYLMTQIAAVRPKILVTLGSTALKALLGNGVELKDARGKTLAFGDIPLLPTYHPAAILYNRRLEPTLRSDLRKAAKLGAAKRARIKSGPPRKGKPTKPTASSGAAVVGPGGRILLLRRADEDIWCLPKGTVEPGESLEQTAVREVREETGLRVRLLRPIHEVRYSFFWPPGGVNYDKTVTYFLAEPVGGRLEPESGFDEVRWVSREEAMRLLHWKNDKEVVDRAFQAARTSHR
jgi:uracil-DNA glycosylase